MDELQRISARRKISINDPDENPYDDQDPDWIVKEMTNMVHFKDKKRRKIQEAGKYVFKLSSELCLKIRLSDILLMKTIF